MKESLFEPVHCIVSIYVLALLSEIKIGHTPHKSDMEITFVLCIRSSVQTNLHIPVEGLLFIYFVSLLEALHNIHGGCNVMKCVKSTSKDFLP